MLLSFSHSVMSDLLWLNGLQHTRPPCPSPSPGACSNSCPLSWWCYPTISSSVVPFSSCLQSFPTSGSFLVSWLFASGGQSIRASVSILPMNTQGGFFQIDQFYLLAVQGTLKSLLQPHSSEASICWCSVSFMVQLSHPYTPTEKPIALTILTLSAKQCLCFVICCRGLS